MKKYLPTTIAVLFVLLLGLAFGQMPMECSDEATKACADQCITAPPVAPDAETQPAELSIDAAREALTKHEQQQKEECAKKLTAALEEHGFVLYPSVIITPDGLRFGPIDLRKVQ